MPYPKPPGINDLYASQAEVLDIWFGGQRNDKDVVIKLLTGGGKTLVALLMAQSVMNEHAEPVLLLGADQPAGGAGTGDDECAGPSER